MEILGLRPHQIDPSRTVTLRRAFYTQLKRRYALVKKAIRLEVVTNDALGLKPYNKNRTAFNEYWRHLDTSQKLEAFMTWLNQQVDLNLMTVDWHSGFIEGAYRSGAGRAFSEARKKEEILQSEEFFEGTKSEFMNQAFSSATSIDSVAVLFGQSFEALKGINAAMAADIRRTLAEHLVRGSSQGIVAKALYANVDNITRNRAYLLAQTEIIRAHAEGELDSYELLGIDEVGALVEWGTAGDDRVCPRCKAMEGKKYKIKEARGLIPLHPGCRCTWVPYIKVTK